MRARNIKPSFFKNEDLAECSPWARLLFIGLWCMAYKEGIVELRAKKIKAEIFPYEDGKIKIDELLEQLTKFNFITILEHVESKDQIILINKFTVHQSPHRNEKSCNIEDLHNYREITGNSSKVISPLMNEERGKRNDERGKMRPDFISEKEWEELIKVRKDKKLLLTETALKPFINQIELATQRGYTVQECIEEFATSKWTRFKADWMQEKRPGQNKQNEDRADRIAAGLRKKQ